MDQDQSKDCHSKIGSKETADVCVLSTTGSHCVTRTSPGLFLDDLQWAEPASIDLITALVGVEDIKGLMIIGAVRENDMPLHQSLSLALRQLKCQGTIVTDINIKNFTSEEVSAMISGILNLPVEKSSHSLLWCTVKHMVIYFSFGKSFVL
jgi:hypothetical protein